MRWNEQQVLNDDATRVLLPDGRTRPIVDVGVGDVVLGTEIVEGVRRYVPTQVLTRRCCTKPAYAVRLAAGTELIVGGEHRFLTDAGWRHVSGDGAARSCVRDRFSTAPARSGPTCPAPHPAYRAGYLCGLIRSDGPRFPSDRLRLEALGRAHHLLAETARAGGARRSAGVPGSGPAGAGPGRVDLRAGVAPGRTGERLLAPARRRVGERVARTAGPVTVVAEPGRIARVASAPLDAAAWPERPGDEWCAGFLAGVIDARGEVSRGELRVVHSDEEIVGRVAGALHRLGFAFAIEALPGGARAVRLRGGPGVLRRLLVRTGPAVTRRLDGAPVVGASETAVVEVRATGHAIAMHDITTGTGDVVAEGVVSHNCGALR